MKIKFWTYVKNLYDGSNCVELFKSKEEAEQAALPDDERYCDDIQYHELEVDDNGELVKVLR